MHHHDCFLGAAHCDPIEPLRDLDWPHRPTLRERGAGPGTVSPVQLAAVARRVWGDLREPRPPACPPEWVAGPPDFVGVGVQRCGTTWWYDLVTAHPMAHRGPTKELQYLRRFWQRPFGPAEAAEYHRFFPRPPGLITGEWSPGYLSHFWVPPLLHEAAPDARVLVLVRDPVERYVSGFALQGETRWARASAASMAFRLGCYATHLDQLFASIPRSQVLVLQYERCVASAADELARHIASSGSTTATCLTSSTDHATRIAVASPRCPTRSARRS